MAEKIVKDSQGLVNDLANDCISRYGVAAWLDNMGYTKLAYAVMDKDRFPYVQPKSYREGYQAGFKDAQPERKRGEWVYAEDEYGIDGYHCNQCGFFVPWDYAHKFINYIEDYHFCPNCGANMRGEKDE